MAGSARRGCTCNTASSPMSPLRHWLGLGRKRSRSGLRLHELNLAVIRDLDRIVPGTACGGVCQPGSVRLRVTRGSSRPSAVTPASRRSRPPPVRCVPVGRRCVARLVALRICTPQGSRHREKLIWCPFHPKVLLQEGLTWGTPCSGHPRAIVSSVCSEVNISRPGQHTTPSASVWTWRR